MDRTLQMLQLQQQLNDATNGKGWENGLTKNGKKIDWRRCIYMECAEMIDSFAWKHWKSINAPADWENLQIEVVDVWHFVMSEALRDFAVHERGSVEALAHSIDTMASYRVLESGEAAFAEEAAVMEKVEEVMADALAREAFELEKLMDNFFELVSMSSLNLTQLYRLYVGKNILNRFRQDHGYKEGNYVKVWNGEEDNVVMKRIWEESGELTPEALYAKLENAYQNAT